ncbi:MAG: lysophospholipid acyltransferase family protein [Desulfobacteraceae bacterium]|jgi:KDO2-lipid IV(A) lauroyltransferase
MIYRLLRTIVLLISYIPFPVGQFLGRILGTAVSVVPMIRTGVVLENIQQSFDGLMGKGEAKKLLRRVFMHFGQMVFEVPHVLRLSPVNLDKYVIIDGEENLRDAIKKGRGAFVLTGHFGNWELMSGAVALRFGNAAVVARPFDFKPLDRLMLDLRSRFDTEVVYKHRAMRRLVQLVKEKKMVGILLDQNVDWYEGAFVNFLGRRACTNKGLALMALRFGTPVVPVFSLRQKDGRYRIVIEREVNLIITGDRTRDIEENTALFTAIIEAYVRKYPDHWFWFHRRWKTRPYCPLPEDFYSSSPSPSRQEAVA